MKSRIHFEELKPGLWFVIMLAAFILIVVATLGLLDLIEIEEKTRSVFLAAGLLIQAVFFLRIFLYKIYVQYNKKGIMLRLQHNKSLSFKYSELKSVQREGTQSIRIERTGEPTTTLHLEHLELKDVDQLATLLQQHL